MIINATPGSSTTADTEPDSNKFPEGKGKMQLASGGMRGGYVGLMNCVFAAQKAVSCRLLSAILMNGTCQLTLHITSSLWDETSCGLITQKVPIDVLTLPPPTTGTSAPIFLQQAAHLTDGVYWRWNGRGALLQYLHVSLFSGFLGFLLTRR
jgi:transcription initiation factor TFIIH subunit 3